MVIDLQYPDPGPVHGSRVVRWTAGAVHERRCGVERLEKGLRLRLVSRFLLASQVKSSEAKFPNISVGGFAPERTRRRVPESDRHVGFFLNLT